MAIVSKVGYKRNNITYAVGGTCGSSYYGFGGPYYYTTWINNPGETSIDICYVASGFADTNWKAVLASQGYLPTRQYWVRRIRGKQSPVTFDRTQHTDGPIYSRTVGAAWKMAPNVSVLPPNFSTANQNHGVVKLAKNRCLTSARDVKVSLPIAFAEGRKTVQMLAETARKLAEAYKAFRKGNFRRVAELLGVPSRKGNANNWLQYQYGWMPLLMDLKGLADLAMQELALGGRMPRFHAYGRAKENGSLYQVIGSNDPLQKENIGGYTESTIEVSPPELVGKAWLYLEVQYSDAALASQLGFGGFSDIASVAWESVPFSFVFDWFVDVATMLAVSSSLKGLAVLDGGCSLEQKSTVKKWASKPAWYSNYAFSWVNPGPVYQGTDMYYQRLTWNGDAPGYLNVRGFDGLNAKRIISAIALLTQR